MKSALVILMLLLPCFTACKTCGNRPLIRPLASRPPMRMPPRSQASPPLVPVRPSQTATSPQDQAEVRDLRGDVAGLKNELDQLNDRLAADASVPTPVAELVMPIHRVPAEEEVEEESPAKEVEAKPPREKAGSLLSGSGPGFWITAAQWAGLGGPIGIGVGIGGWLIFQGIRYRRKKRTEESTTSDAEEASPGPLEGDEGYRDYAEQQADLYTAAGGRDALYDQTIGRLYDQELAVLANQSQDDGLRTVYGELKDRVTANARRIFTKDAGRSIQT